MSNILTVLGIMMTVISAIISYTWVQDNNENIMEYARESARLERLISDKWQLKIEQDNRKGFSTIIAMLLNNDDGSMMEAGVRKYIDQTYIFAGLPVPDGKVDLPALYKKIDADTTRTIDAINTVYGDKLSVDTTRSDLQSSTRLLQGVVLALQIMGLILVLLSGVRRGDSLTDSL
jgi:hypothetical protein